MNPTQHIINHEKYPTKFYTYEDVKVYFRESLWIGTLPCKVTCSSKYFTVKSGDHKVSAFGICRAIYSDVTTFCKCFANTTVDEGLLLKYTVHVSGVSWWRELGVGWRGEVGVKVGRDEVGVKVGRGEVGQGGHIRAEIKFPVFSLSFPCVTNFFPVFFFHKINRWFWVIKDLAGL